MRIFLTGVGCVGKTTIGKIMGALLGVRFFDLDKEKKFYLREYKLDIAYFRPSYRRANLQVDIAGLDPDQSARKVKEAVEELDGKVMQQAKSQ
jgi:dephospho-CoA kinase